MRSPAFPPWIVQDTTPDRQGWGEQNLDCSRHQSLSTAAAPGPGQETWTVCRERVTRCFSAGPSRSRPMDGWLDADISICLKQLNGIGMRMERAAGKVPRNPIPTGGGPRPFVRFVLGSWVQVRYNGFLPAPGPFPKSQFFRVPFPSGMRLGRKQPSKAIGRARNDSVNQRTVVLVLTPTEGPVLWPWHRLDVSWKQQRGEENDGRGA
ncbi:hypothetical protein BRADI_1g21022v3 [Brachypodium distachyon]|uniref:Uncharacterized protein n=1 Tax=Brachypodium distachyon TaxID=15368 RepID=A0A2K2DKA8_BRADI|nr:hypothetical protein BRADI_1g21022v3 [Brachypodium distachyon]